VFAFVCLCLCVRRISIRIGPDCELFREDSEYGIPVAIWEMLHNSKIELLIGIDNI
jgi:hypothetical protein